MASSEVQICNLGLSWIGGAQITSFSDDSEEAKFCSANYELLRDAVLEEKEWTFAVTRFEPAALAAAPDWGWDKAFQIPPTVLRVLQVTKATTDVVSGGPTERSGTGLGRYNKVEWIREGDQILANGATQIYVRALQQITDVTKFSPGFVQALAARIAMEGAVPLRESRQLMRDMASLYGEKVAMAGTNDGQQGRSAKTRSSSLTEVR